MGREGLEAEGTSGAWGSISCFRETYVIFLTSNKLVAFLLLSYRCIVTTNVLWLFLTLPWVGLQSVIVVFPNHTHLLFCYNVVYC